MRRRRTAAASLRSPFVARRLALDALLAGVVGAGVLGTAAFPCAAEAEGTLTLGGISDSLEAISERVAPAVVQIFAYRLTPALGSSGERPLVDREENVGSGVVLDPSGWIVTNAHVVDGARSVRVLVPGTGPGPERPGSILAGRTPLLGAQVAGLDRETDLAVLKITPGGPLAYLELANSDELRQGELIFAFGSPRGLANSVSMGVVSAKARQIGPESPMVYIQTDATINPGNSGGPLVDTRGRVVGINTFILSQSGGSEGIGFAAPANIVRNVYEQLRATGRVRRGEIGVHAQTIGPRLAEALSLPVSWGVILGDVVPEGPADRAGLRVGDVVLALDGKPMENGRQLDVNLYRVPIGRTVTLEILRGGERRMFSVPVTERKEPSPGFDRLVNADEHLVAELGILAIGLDERVRDLLPPLRRRGGVLVAASLRRGAPFDPGLEPGDVIRLVNGRDVNDLEGLRKALRGLPFGTPVAVHVQRLGRLEFVLTEIR